MSKCDINRYRHYLDQCDLTEEQKVNLAQSIWNFIENFLDKQFGLNQPSLDFTGKDRNITTDQSKG